MWQKINLFLWVWIQTFRAMKQGKTFVPFLFLALLQGAILAILLYFAYPPFSLFLVPIIRRYVGEVALHYPNNFLALPQIYNRANILLGGIVGIVVIGLATQIFATVLQRKSPSLGKDLGKILSRYGWLMIVWLVETILILLIMGGVPSIVASFIQSTRAVKLISYAGGLLISSAFAYTTALVVLDNRRADRAIIGSLHLFAKNIIISFFLVAIPSLFHLPINYLAGRSEFLIAKFVPETVAVVLLSGIGISILTNYFLVGTVTGFYLVVRSQPEGGAYR